MNNNRNKSYRVGNTLLTGMTAAEVEKLHRIMNPAPSKLPPIIEITLREYIERFNPSVRRWISKAGNPMVEVEVLHDKVYGNLYFIQQERHLDRVTVCLKEGAE